MKARFLNYKWIALSLIVVSFSAGADGPAKGGDENKPLEKARMELQGQGFKTSLTNFDFSTSPGLRDRETILIEAIPRVMAIPAPQHPDLMETNGNNRVIVVWEQDALWRKNLSRLDESHELPWKDFEDATARRRSQLDAASMAILSGPVQFDLNASAGNGMLLPHLAHLKNLTEFLNDRVMVALHRGDRETAWTNLMAGTRLVTAWNIEPVEVSHRTRFNNMKLVFNATWQALQTNGWKDEQLARLQHEWETTDFLGGLPEIQAFRRASDLDALEHDSLAPQMSENDRAEDEARLLLFYRDREVEYRHAVQAGSWLKLRSLPNVTNETIFESKHRYRGRFEGVLQRRAMMNRIARQASFLTQAAEAEAERRILITALALERYHGRYQHYPKSLETLAPEFLKSAVMDFMTGEPLHYQVTEDGHVVLYSVGFDCVDNGGKILTLSPEEERVMRLARQNTDVADADLVWPLALPSAQVVSLRQQQLQAEAERNAQREAAARVEAQQQEKSARETRAAAMKKLLAEKPSLGQEPAYQGKPLSSWVDKIGEIEKYNGAPKDAVEAIRAIGSKAVPFLLEWMPHPGAERPVDGYPDWSSVNFAWWAVGTNGAAAIPELTRMINRPQHSDDDYSVWTESAEAISYLGPNAIAPMLAAATNMQGKHEMWELLDHFKNLGTNGAPAVPELIRWANDGDYFVRSGVFHALGGIGKRPDLAVPVLLNALDHDTNGMVRRDAGEALGVFAGDSDAVLPALTKTLKDPDWQARGGALSGLGKIHDKPEVVVPLITPFLYDHNNVLQRTAAYALRDLGSEAGYRALLQASNAPSSWPGIGDIIYEVQQKMQPGKSR